jgi:pyridoxal 5'-phosphate synthase glutaminase subunit Pdx2
LGDSRPVIGVLALQGAYAAHARALTDAGAEPRLVKRPEELEGLDGLVIPGGESTTFLKHLERDGFFAVLREFVRETPTFGTCAGAILLATDVQRGTQCVWTADRLEDYDSAYRAARGRPGDGIYSRAEDCEGRSGG